MNIWEFRQWVESNIPIWIVIIPIAILVGSELYRRTHK